MILDQRREKDTKIEDEKEMKNKPKKKKLMTPGKERILLHLFIYKQNKSRSPPPPTSYHILINPEMS